MILKLQNISKYYEQIRAVDSVSMEINEGEMLGLVEQLFFDLYVCINN